MTQPDHKLDPIEQTLAELAEAEQAGVFRATRLDECALLMGGHVATRPAWLKWGKHWAALAAMLGLTIIVWSAMFNMQLNQIDSATNRSVVLTDPETGIHNVGCDGDFLRCFNGPTILAAATCKTFDFDLDGDIDMLDMQTYQQNCQGLRRNR